MAVKLRFQQIQCLFLFLFFAFFLPPYSSQSTPQNIQVYFPVPTPPPPPQTATTDPSRSSNKTIAKAVAVTAGSTLVLSGLLFLLLVKFKHRWKQETINLYADDGDGIDGVIADEQGLDVIYWKKLEDDGNFEKDIVSINGEEGKRTMKIKNGSPGSRVWPVAVHHHHQQVVENQIMMKSQLSLQSPSPPGLPLSSPAVPAPPPPPFVVKRKGGALPPPPTLPPKIGGLTWSSGTPAKDNMSLSENHGQVKLKPLHWEKVNANVGHSMAWHQLQNGSFRVDDDLMETLFGTKTINKKPPQEGANNPTPVFLLDTRKSQNIAIVLKSLPVSRGKIIDCLLQGKGLDRDTLEKLIRITPDKETLQIILQFQGDVTRLANAESFLYQILKSVPSAFTRFNLMLFKSNYSTEVADLKNSLRTLEMACKEVKTRGIFHKLLEAVLKAGNRMNAGTSRGNAQAFNLNSLLKLSDVKSSDGRSTLLDFVVEEVIRSEGKRCNSHRNQTENYYIKLGLPVVGGVSLEFSNVQKAARIDYDAFAKSCSALSNRLVETTEAMEECNGDGGGFVREMMKFLNGAEGEIRVLREEEERIMRMVKKTNEYYNYQAGDSKDQFRLFVIIRDFLQMVDKACIDIAIKLQNRRTGRGLRENETETPKPPDRPP